MPQSITSVRQLAKALSVNPGTVSRYTKRSDWPFPRTCKDWAPHLAAIRQWQATHLSPDPGAEAKREARDPIEQLHLSPKREAEIKLLITRQAKLELERAIMAGEYVSKADEQRADAAKVAAVRAGLQQLLRRVATMVTPDVESVLADEIRLLCEAFAEGR